MSIWKRTLPCVVMVALVASLSAPAAEDKAAEKAAAPAPAPPSADEIAALVKQLDSDKFAERQAASDKLSEIGKPAIGAVAEAAGGESLEVTVRAIDILKKMLESSDKATKEGAKGALGKIAKSERPAAARRAGDALKELEEKEKQRQAPRFAPGGIQIAVAGGGARRVSVRNVNGVKTIEADEGDRKVKIVDDPNQGIKMEVTTKKNGKQSTEKYEAKNAEDLKKKHPKAYETYKRYSKQGGNFMVQMQVAGGRVPIRVQPRRPNPVETAARILPALTSHINRLASDEAIKGASKESNEALRKKVAEVREQLEDLDKRLQKAIEESEKEKKEEKKEEKKDEEGAEKAGQPEQNAK